MERTTDSALLPIIVADLLDASAVDFLNEIARANGKVLVPLTAAPVDHGDHVLEVHAPELAEPVLYIARPLGPPRPQGFPLQLRLYGSAPTPVPARDDNPSASTSPRLKARRSTRQKLSVHHSRDLTGDPMPFGVEVNLVGRSLASGKLSLDALLGEGAMGAVYRATEKALRRVVAVKVLRDGVQKDLEFCQRFHAEALAASRLDHHNLIRVFDFGQEPDGLLYISMEFLDGGSLEDLLREEKTLAHVRAVDIVMQVAAGLWHAHQRGIVHRDIKPANIVLVDVHNDDGRTVETVKICDFGIALQATSAESERGVAGTPEYMSPEQCEGHALDGRADIYACGVMLYELVTGRLPFEGTRSWDLMRQHLIIPPKAPSTLVPNIDPLLDKVILRALAKSPDDRYASAGEFRAALKEIFAPAGAPRSMSRADLQKAQPAAAPAPEPPPATATGQDWLEDPKTSYNNFFTSQAGDSAQQPEADLLAAELTKAPVERLKQMAMLRAGPSFAPEAERLETAVKTLARRFDANALTYVVQVMSAIYGEEAKQHGERAGLPGSTGERALRVLHTIADPITLRPFAERLLTEHAEPTAAAMNLLAWAQVAGAHALYAARLKHIGPAARRRFIAAMRVLGPHAAPIVRAALDQLLPSNAAVLADVALANDLLRAAPNAQDDALGSVIARFAWVPDSPELVKTALEALEPTWGERAVPVLLASLGSHHEEVRIATLRGLRNLGAVDEIVVKKVEALIAGTVSASDALRIAAAEALSSVTPQAHAVAKRAVLSALGRPAQSDPSTAPFVVALARTAMLLAPTEAPQLILERADKSAESLAAQLVASTRPR